MRVKSISLKNYRNYETLVIEPETGINVFAGSNAAGKTNILESVYFCSTGRSHRARSDAELIRHSQPHAEITIEAERYGGAREIKVLLTPDYKSILIDSKPIKKLGELLGNLCVVLFSPEDLRIVKDGPGERRRFMNITLCQSFPSYFSVLQDYGKIIRQRNILLKKPMNDENSAMLDVWDERASETGAKLIYQRKKYISRLSPLVSAACMDISGEELSAEYVCCAGSEDEASIKLELMDMLRAEREADIQRGSTKSGPHRDDINLTLNGADLRFFGSQGQQRTATLALKLSELKLMEDITGQTPVLLLDDVFSELDESRREKLLGRISGTQCFVTTTNAELSALPEGCNMYSVKNGNVELC